MFLVVLASGGSPAARIADTGPLTASALVTIAIFAMLVIVGILYGVRQKRIRAAAEEEERERTAELTGQDDAPAPAPERGAPPPVEPAAATPPAAGAEAPAKPATVRKAPAPQPEPALAEPVGRPEPSSPVPATEKPAPAPTTAYALIDVKGLGPKAVPLLAAAGVTDLATLAALTPARAAEVDGQLGALSGRLTRDRWVEQARLLAAGDIAAFEATFGKL